ncbi:MAG: hypothetical protein ACRDVC_02900 [Acidimicrobiales bacterium]
MARTRAQRRRHTLFIALALAITLLVLLFARDVSRAAHGAITPRRSEDRSFAALANSLLTQENQFDGRLESLLDEGMSLRRVVFAARLFQLNDQLSSWSVAGDLLRHPTLSHDVNEALGTLTDERVAAYQTLLGDVAGALELPWTTTPHVAVANPAATLIATSERWNVDRYALRKEPGRVRLDATSASSARYFRVHGVSLLTRSPSLALVRAVSIDAVRVSPAALPAARGVMLLPPVKSVELDVSVLNASYDDQPVTITIHVVPLNHRGAAYSSQMSATLGPLGAFAFAPNPFSTAASEQASVVIRVFGARAAVGKVTVERYRLKMSPSGNTGRD